MDLDNAPIAELLGLLFDAKQRSFDYVPTRELKQLHARRALFGHPYGQASPSHADDVVSYVFESDVALDLDRLNLFFDTAQLRYGTRLWRYKGIVRAERQRARIVIQGVQGLLQVTGGTVWRAFETQRTLLVFIGQGIEPIWLEAGLRDCEVRAVSATA